MSSWSPSVLVALITLAAPAPDASVVCRWKLEKGKTFYQEVTTDTRQDMKVAGQDVAQTQKQTFTYSWTPLRQEGADWVLRQRIEAVRLEIDISGNKIAYDSTRPGAGNNPLTDFFKALVGTEFTVTLDRDMRVRTFAGREEFLNKLVASNPAMQPMLEGMLSEAAMKEMVEPTFASLPPRPLEKGETWARVSKLDMGPAGRYTMTYEFVQHSKTGPLLRFNAEHIGLKYEPPQNQGTNQPWVITKANLNSKKGSGFVLFDVEKGRVTRAETSLEIQGDLEITISGQATSVELHQTQKTTVTTTDSNPLRK